MIKKYQLRAILVGTLGLVGSTTPMGQVQVENVIGEGPIVAFDRQSRHRAMPYTRGTGTYIELWIVRIDRWVTEKRTKRYFLVQYKLKERAVNDQQINHPTLRFTLREPGPHDFRPCVWSVFGDDKSSSGRRMTLSDFERTKPGHSDPIPPLEELPCLIAEKPPTPVKAQQR